MVVVVVVGVVGVSVGQGGGDLVGVIVGVGIVVGGFDLDGLGDLGLLLLIGGPLGLMARHPNAEDVQAGLLGKGGLVGLDLNLVFLGHVLVLDGLILDSGLREREKTCEIAMFYPSELI